MSERIVATLPRRTVAAIARRASLLTLGGVVLATVAPAATTRAGKAGKRAGKKAKKKCKRQVGQCRAAWAEICMGDASCESHAFPCCEHLARCDAGAYVACVSVAP